MITDDHRAGVLQFDALCNAIAKDSARHLQPYAQALQRLQLLRVLLPTITALPGISRIGCAVRAVRLQQVVEQVSATDGH